MKKNLFACAAIALLLGAGSARAADEAQLNRMKKDLEILVKIVKTSMGLDERDMRFGRFHGRDADKLTPQKIETLYLAGQGVVMTLELGQDAGFFGMIAPGPELAEVFVDLETIGAVPMPEFAPKAPPAGLSGEERQEWEEEERERAEEAREAAAELAEEVAMASAEIADSFQEAFEEMAGEDYFGNREARDKLRAMREQQRRLVSETREKVRETQRMLLRRQQLSDADREALVKELDAHKGKLNQQVEEYRRSLNELKATQNQEWETKLSAFENELLDAVCRYGATVQSLPDGERFTLVLKRAERGGGERKDRVYILTKTDLIACRDGKLSVDGLKAKAERYAF